MIPHPNLNSPLRGEEENEMKFTASSLKGALLLGSLLAVGTPAFAVPVTGILGFSGTSLFTFTITPGDSYIDFREPVAGGTGAIDSDNRTGFFTAVGANEMGTIRDMSSLNVAPYAWVPVNTTVAIDDFLLFPSISATTNIRLTRLPLANCSGGGTCVGPFQLLQSGSDVSVSINILGEILNNRTSANPDRTTFSGTITAQFLGTNVASVIAAASSPNGVNADSYSGAILASSPVPEPGTVTMLGIGAAAILFGRLRSKRRSDCN
jgi:hypothetical protein